MKQHSGVLRQSSFNVPGLQYLAGTRMQFGMLVQFWGVRGSIPVPGPDTTRYGGNTPCLTVSLDEDHTLILDAGTGLASFGRTLSDRNHTYFVLLSHVHWDHIQGLPLFAPLMSPRTRVVFLTGMDPTFMDTALSQLDGVRFPLRLVDCPARIEQDNREAEDVLSEFDLTVSWMPANHSGTCFAYRLAGPANDLIYMTDNELGPERANVTTFCHGADFLVHDAQFTEAERSRKTGWGHSFVSDVCVLAQEASVGELILFHHDPNRTDAQLDRIQADARSRVGTSLTCCVAAEGMGRAL